MMSDQPEYTTVKVKHTIKWTKEMMDNAQPIFKESKQYIEPEPRFEEQFSGKPRGHPPKLPSDYKPQDKYFGSIIEKPQKYPFCCVGKIYLIDNTSSTRVGSGAVIYNNIIITAAHVVYDKIGRKYFTDVVFFPGKNLESILGAFECSYIHIPNKYKDFQDLDETYDVALLKVKTGMDGFTNAGKAVHEVTCGYLGYQANLNIHECSWADVGYPKGIEDGNVMWADQGFILSEKNHDYKLWVTKTKQHPNIDDHGMSGGPWLLFPYYRDINGIHATTSDLHGTSRSSYFGDWTADFIDAFIEQNK